MNYQYQALFTQYLHHDKIYLQIVCLPQWLMLIDIQNRLSTETSGDRNPAFNSYLRAVQMLFLFHSEGK